MTVCVDKHHKGLIINISNETDNHLQTASTAAPSLGQVFRVSVGVVDCDVILRAERAPPSRSQLTPVVSTANDRLGMILCCPGLFCGLHMLHSLSEKGQIISLAIDKLFYRCICF